MSEVDYLEMVVNSLNLEADNLNEYLDKIESRISSN